MPDHLVFTLSAAIGSMGDVAGHERRGTMLRPGRSAVLGLVAAALGLKRDDAEGLAALESLKLAVAVHDAGEPLRDYHTVQTIPSNVVKRPDSRRAAFKAAKGRENTTVTQRDYRTDPLFAVALWGDDALLARISLALAHPTFCLWLGRKSCPLSAPTAPVIVEATGPIDALTHARLPPWRSGGTADMVASDPAPGISGRIERRHDQVRDRAAWHFSARDVVIVALGGEDR